MTLDHTRKRKLPDWLLCRESIVYNPVSLFTIAFNCAVRTCQTIELREDDFYKRLAHKDPVHVVFEGGCCQEECWKQSAYAEKKIHSHTLPTDNFVFYNPYLLKNIQHIYYEKFDYVPATEEEIDARRKHRLSIAGSADRRRRLFKCKRKLFL